LPFRGRCIGGKMAKVCITSARHYALLLVVEFS